jgi:5'-deoxynucleotidase YfbR-like HD superfamily hydrolase
MNSIEYRNEAEIYEEIKQCRALNFISRCPGTRLNRTYTDAEHCFHTALIFKIITDMEAVDISADDLHLVMMHDFLETKTGDLNYLAKNLNQTTKRAWEDIEREIVRKYHECGNYTDRRIERALGEKKTRIFKASDMMELLFAMDEEVRSGNKAAIEIRDRAARILHEFNMDIVDLIVDYLIAESKT